MKTYIARYWAVYGIALLGPALTGCTDDTQATDTDSDTSTSTTTGAATTDLPTTTIEPTTTPPTTTDPSTTTTTGPDTTTTGDPETSTTSTTTGESSGTTGAVSASSSTTGADVCMTILCGEPAACCAEGDECVDGECLPACPSGVRCGPDKSICCGDGQVCLGDKCESPLGACSDSYDCDPGNYCEPIFDQCLPQPDPLDCEVVPSFDKIEVQLEWAWTADEVISTPAIADVDGDGTPDVVVNATRMDGMNYPIGEIVLIDGATGLEKWRIKHEPANMRFGSHGRSTIAVGDVNGDLLPDIIYAGRQEGAGNVSPVHAVDGTGALIWTARNPNNTIAKVRIENGAAALTNFDSDPEAEIVFGASIFDNDGLMVWNQANAGAMFGTPLYVNGPNVGKPIYPGGLATLADLDNDGYPEIVTGREAWKVSWVAGNPPMVSLSLFWQNKSGAGNDGWPSVADLDGNGTPEVVLTAYPEIRVIDGLTGKLWCGVDSTGVMCNANEALRTQPILIKGGNLGGPATIADFDGDGRPEAGIAAGVAYAVYDFNRSGEQIVKPAADPMPKAGAIYVRWSSTTQDASSAATGSSVFDFQGDGAAEAVYQDECFARVYDGKNGTVQLQIMNSSSTIHEYPLVADVDGDGNSEFIVVANFSEVAANDLCKTKTPNFATRKGVYLYGAGGDNWVPTRPVWTQHTYHVTNTDSAGNVPMMEQANWTVGGLNNFRQNVQGEGVFNAPDLTVSLSVGLEKCSGELVLKATIYNEGALGVAKGVDVTFFEGMNNQGTKLGTKPTIEDLLPGASTTVTWTVPAPPEGQKTSFFAEIDPGINNGLVNECSEDNNGALVTEAECPTPG